MTPAMRIKKAMQERGVGYTDIERQLGIPKNTLKSAVDRNSDIGLENAVRLAEFLGLDLYYLAGKSRPVPEGLKAQGAIAREIVNNLAKINIRIQQELAATVRRLASDDRAVVNEWLARAAISGDRNDVSARSHAEFLRNLADLIEEAPSPSSNVGNV